jgi:hypothetical protein
VYDILSGMTNGIKALKEELERLDVGSGHATVDGDLVRELAELRDRVDAKLAEAFGGFVAHGGHQVEGWRSPAGWAAANLPVTRERAGAMAKQADRLRAWPILAGLWFDGHLNGGQVDTVVARVGRAHTHLYGEHDHAVSPLLVGLSVLDTKMVVADWDRKADAVTSVDPTTVTSDEVDARLDLSRVGDRGRVDGDLDPDTTATVEKALEVFSRPLDDGSGLTAAQRRAEALGRVARFALDHRARGRRRPARQHPHVDVVIELRDLYADLCAGLGIRTADDLERFLEWRPTSTIEEALIRAAFDHASGRARTRDGHALTPTAVATVFGTGTLLSRLLLADGRVLDQGRDVRFVQDNLRDAMLARDLGCRFPGCDAPVAWIDGHHLRSWRQGGATSLDNAAALCSSHHGVVHSAGWALAAADDGTLSFHRPDGTTLTSPPPRPARPAGLPLPRPGGTACRPVPPPEPHTGADRDHPPPTRSDETCGTSDDGQAPWVVTLDDPDEGLPVEGHLGHHRFHIDWDTRTPAERRADRAGMHRRLADLTRREPPTPPSAPLTEAA